MVKTHEQEVVSAKLQISSLKADYMSSLTDFIATPKEQKISKLTNVLASGNKYFNYVEEFVGNSNLLGAHDNPKWVIGFAEDCAEVLNSLLKHFNLIFKTISSLQPDLLESAKPGATAYANMQRMVLKYLTPEIAKKIENDFKMLGLPTYGFDNYKLPFMTKEKQIYLSFSFGVSFLITLIIIAVVIPNPTGFQYTIFRIILSIAAGGAVAAFPGFIEVKLGKWLRAGGALAVFVLVYFWSPAAIEMTNSKSPIAYESK
ncbi:hypothetical protein MJO52_11935 [Microbulbifer variabilis]|uniref:Uncharacterized protein n=1 Tax=Microbulbifer variabilis TaxID=266805 RepID=A0ABY4V9A3_9GAMM|nr:hypothetical protein [Microbulbifer variabilis]USD19793.1 hypothetical protein MJO52_11935 [Microbulbifer variabilis]